MSNVLFSIVLPTYNVYPYIERCIISIINQCYKDFEAIFVDDCGKDNSISVVKKYQRNDSRIKIISNRKNLGTYHARRNGVYGATGKYIVFLDPDDELECSLLSRLAAVIKKTECDMVFY